ncbi:MAG: hypothetical protein NT013_25100 [Planctomycetia bacterium]|nr:hypothetical protein [Planctomycetia bacterium]
MSRRCQIVFLLLLAALPVCIVTKEFSTEHGFLDLPLFGKAFLPHALPIVQEIDPPARSEHGYDGQFYAQLALSPLLTDPDLPRACDNVQFRARRIGLPMLAYAVGLGQPVWVLQAYSVLNLFFWWALLGALAHFVGFAGVRERLLAVAILWTSGTLTSVERSLADLPSMTISLCGLLLAETHVVTAGGLLAVAALFRETSALSFPALAWIDREHPPRRLAWLVPLLVAPVTLWFVYVRLQTPRHSLELNLFSFPFVGWWEKIAPQLTRRPQPLVELLAPIAIFVQVTYFALRPRLASRWWRWGCGWAALAVVVGAPIWEEQIGFCRILLPLTVAFNVLVYQHERNRHYVLWFLFGNLWLFERAIACSPRWLDRTCLIWLAFECWHHWSATKSASASAQVLE